MLSITMTSTTPISRVLFSYPQAADSTLNDPQAADSILNVGVRVGFNAPMHKAPAVKDVAYLRSWSPPV